MLFFYYKIGQLKRCAKIWQIESARAKNLRFRNSVSIVSFMLMAEIIVAELPILPFGSSSSISSLRLRFLNFTDRWDYDKESTLSMRLPHLESLNYYKAIRIAQIKAIIEETQENILIFLAIILKNGSSSMLELLAVCMRSC